MTDTDSVTGEAGIIDDFMAPLAAAFPGAFGLKDDCAVLSPAPGEDIVLKTDAIAEGVHFLAENDPADIGWKALAVNMSDLAAKGARPLAYLMSLSFPQAPRKSWLAGFTAGLRAAQDAFGVHLAGGDTDRRPGPLSVTIAAFGSVPAGRMVRRATARAGDVLLVSGTLGDAALGLRLMRDPVLARRWGLGDADRRHLYARFVRPQPRLSLRDALLHHARAAMDLSDGLAKDLGRMARASGVGATVDVERLPVSAAARRALVADPGLLSDLVTGGDDYEVLTAVPQQSADAYVAAAGAAGVQVTAVGVVTSDDKISFLDGKGAELVLPRTGWDHF